jgi:EmrB/QacA subfamily drug resistance transporter
MEGTPGQGAVPSGPVPRQGQGKWWSLVAVSGGMFMLLLDITIVAVALPAIQRQLHASLADLQWVVDAYAMTLAALLLTTGSLADLYGRRRLFAGGLAVFTVGSLLCGTATSPLFLIVARCGQGLGGAAMLATSLALLAQAYQGKDRAVAFAVWGAVMAVAIAVGPLVGGLLTQGASWRWIFLVNVPLGVLTLGLTLRRVPESKDPAPRRPDWLGFLSFTAALVALVLGLIRASQTSFTNPVVLACLVAAGGLALAFVAIEQRVPHPMFDLSLFRVPTFDGALLASFAISASFYSLLLYLVLYLQDALGESPLQAGLRLLVISGSTFLTSAAAGRLSRQVPVRWLVAFGLALVALGLGLLSGLAPADAWTAALPGFLLVGLGNGIVNPPLAQAAMGVVPPSRAGMASGINNTFRQTGIAAGVAALGTIFADRERAVLARALAQGHLPSAVVGRVVALVKAGAPPRQVLAGLSAHAAGLTTIGLRSGLVVGLDDILRVSLVVAALGALGTLSLIRNRDFVAGSHLEAPADTAHAASERPGQVAPAEA